MKSILNGQFFFFLLVIFLYACVDEINFSQPESIKNALSIQGKLTKGDTSIIKVSISEVFNFTDPSRFIDARYVHLLDTKGNELELKSKQQGIYELEIPTANAPLKIEYGEAFQIKIELNNNQIYESTFDTLYPVPNITDLNVKKESIITTNNVGIMDTLEVLIFTVNTFFIAPNSSWKTNFLWEFESVFKLSDSPAIYVSCPRDCQPSNENKKVKTCYVSINPINNYNTLRTANLSANKIENFVLLEQPANSFIFSEGYYLTVLQQSISNQAYEYWSEVNLLTNRDGTIFEPPSGKIITNIRNVENDKEEVYGYFFVTEQSQKRIFVSPVVAGKPKSICPARPVPGGGGPGQCCNCLCEQNSSITKPDWWIE